MIEIEFKDIDGLDENGVIEVLNKNIRTASLCREEIKKLQAASSRMKKVVPNIKRITKKETEVKIEDEEMQHPLEDEIQYYLTQIKETEKKQNLDYIEIESLLPNWKNKNYIKILLRIKLEQLKNIKESLDFIKTLEEREDSELIKELLDDNNKKTKIIKLIDKKIEEFNLIGKGQITPPKIENKLVFVPTKKGNIRVLDDIDHIPSEYYEGFIGLFDSIKDGTFKNAKRFVNNTNLVGLSEVKDFKIRVVFTRLNKDTYAILSAFTKKHDNDNGYGESLKNKAASYRNLEEMLKKSIDDPEFMEYQKEYQEELYDKLNCTKKDVKQLKKGLK